MISFAQLSQTKYIIVLSNKIVLILSGGMDSFTLLNHALSKDYEVHCITFDYGQKHIKEIECAEAISKENNLTHIKIKIASTELIFLNSALTSEEVKVPHGSIMSKACKLRLFLIEICFLFRMQLHMQYPIK